MLGGGGPLSVLVVLMDSLPRLSRTWRRSTSLFAMWEPAVCLNQRADAWVMRAAAAATFGPRRLSLSEVFSKISLEIS